METHEKPYVVSTGKWISGYNIVLVVQELRDKIGSQAEGTKFQNVSGKDSHGQVGLRVGRSSTYSPNNMVIRVGEGFSETVLNLSAVYSEIAVAYYPWGGETIWTGQATDTITRIMEAYQEQLKQAFREF